MSTPDTPQQNAIVTPEQMAAAKGTPQWRWMGNYGDVYGPVAAANSVRAGAGAMHTQIMPDGLVATWLFY
ncbi:MAG: hypothetical protein H0V92_07835 [Pseudonocardiales bacterium]|nr:hypothetical protein [Pseudonocardiales bacterium]